MSMGIAFSLLAGLITIIYVIVSIKWILSKPAGNAKMIEIAGAIQDGASAYLNRQYKTISIVGIIIFAIIALVPALGLLTAIGFAIGAVLSGLAGFVGMNISVRANVRTAEAAKNGINSALAVAFRGGAITGMFVLGLGLIGVTGFYAYLIQVSNDVESALKPLIGLALGSSLISIFARLG